MRQPTEEQVAAASEPRGPVRVLAGAGTGKTAVIAERFGRLVESDLDPASILVMTFSERAAAEMRQRIVDTVGDEQAGLGVGTFHAHALAWLREHGGSIGVPAGFRILTGPDRWIFLRELMWASHEMELIGVERPDDLVTPLLKLLERLKQELVPVADLVRWAKAGAGERAALLLAAARLFGAYEKKSRAERWLDFDDLIQLAVRLLATRPALREAYRRRFQVVMVDEYQDTNLAQERLVELVAGGGGDVFVVGDDDQSIYRFRGASRASMDRFLSSFPEARTRTLGRNLRSSGRIVAAAADLIEHNQHRITKPLTAAGLKGPKIEVWHCPDGGVEADRVAAEIRRQRGAGLALGQMAVLTRTNASAAPILASLERARIPYALRGGHGFYNRPEVKDMIACLRLLDDPGDLIALARLATRLPPKLSLEDLAAVAATSLETEPALIGLAARRPQASWARVLSELAELTGRFGVDELFFEVVDRLRYLQGAAARGAKAARVVANVTRFGEAISEFCERSPDHSLRAFQAYLDQVLLSGIDEDAVEVAGEGDAVHVMTIHQAKGLEFEAVFLPSLVEGRLPQPVRRDRFELPPEVLEPRVRGREDHVAEERRLCYVAVTRARVRLYLSWAERYEGGRLWTPSRFLAEMGVGAQEKLIRTRGSGGGGRAAVPGSGSQRPPRRRRAAPTPVLSFSAVSTYRECPRQYWFKYAGRFPAPATVEAQFGSVLHRTLMRAGQLLQAGDDVGPDRLEGLYRQAWAELELVEPRRQPALEALGQLQLAGYVAAGGLDRRPAMVERSFTTELDGWVLRGIIDRIDAPPPTQEGRGAGPLIAKWRGAGEGTDVVLAPGGNRAAEAAEVALPPAGNGAAGGGARSGSDLGGADQPASIQALGDATGAGAGAGGPWRLVDYKTGSPLPRSRLRRDLQLAFYALGARQALGLDPLELEIVYLKTGKRVLLPADDELLDEARRIGAEVAAGIAAGEFEPRPERRRCRLCPYALACDAAL
jgi:DNA helicase-2/ATP-dependent DNA helicase PcrA